ncbi:MAG: sensor histidine kinase [Planctomycetota bacterium]|jgi:signal transduction histidine kinase
MTSSVRGRLTLWYAVVLAIVLAIYAAGAYAFLVHRVYSEMDSTLRVDFEAAEQLTHGGKPKPHHGDAADRWVEVTDSSGRVIAREGPTGALPGAPEGIESYTTTNGEPVRVLTGRYEGATIRVARSEAHVRQRLREFLLVMGIALPLAVAVACAAGYFLAGRALAPVERIVQRARKITAVRLDERLPVENPDDELGRLAATFNETFARLQHSFEEMKRFTGDAAHELRTPLTALRSVGEVCLRDPGSDPRKAVESMLEEVERMSRLVDGLLRLARADGTDEPVRLQPTDLAEFTTELVERLGIAAEVDAGTPVPVNADPDLLAQALGNVLDNAVRHSPDDVVVVVRAPGTVEVTDRGDGIAPEHTERIFDRFYRVEKSRARDKGGAGLGLAIAKWAVEAQGGRIEVESTQGAGATFRITLG